MSFFEPPPPPPDPPRPQALPEWMGPPDNVLGGPVARGFLAARSEDAAVWLESAVAHPTGVEFRLDVRWRERVQALVMRGVAWPQERAAGEPLPAELFRAGIEFADGGKATWLGPSAGGVSALPARLDDPLRQPLLTPRGGGGGSGRWSQDLWLWPLPPEGRLQFVCEWPALGIELTRTELDSRAIRDAAPRSHTLWEM